MKIEEIHEFVKRETGINLHSIGDGKSIMNLIELFYNYKVGNLLEGEHELEREPRANTWLEERRNWIGEVEGLRSYNIKIEKELQKYKSKLEQAEKMLDKYDLEKFARWLVKNGYCDTDVLPEGENGVNEYLKQIEP